MHCFKCNSYYPLGEKCSCNSSSKKFDIYPPLPQTPVFDTTGSYIGGKDILGGISTRDPGHHLNGATILGGTRMIIDKRGHYTGNTMGALGSIGPLGTTGPLGGLR